MSVGGAPHPATFSADLFPAFRMMLDRCGVKPGSSILDPFAGTGKIHQLRPDYLTVGVELEQEWATMSPFTAVGDATALPASWTGQFDAVLTSPTYGNRMADHHEAKDGSTRLTYRHKLGRPLHPQNTGAMQWGAQYQAMHRKAWAEAHRVLRPDGVFILNIKNHIRGGKVIDVAGWHRDALIRTGFNLVSMHRVALDGMRYGANSELRVDHELVMGFRRVEPASTYEPNPTPEGDDS